MTHSYEVIGMLGASGYNSSADPRKIERYLRTLDNLMSEYDRGGMSADEFQRRRREIELP